MLGQDSIKNKYNKLIRWLIISFAVVTSLFFYIFVNHEINERLKNESFGVINLTKQMLEATLNDAEIGLLSLEEYIIDNPSLEHSNLVLETIKKNINGSSTLYYADKEGSFNLFPLRFVASDYDPRIRPWYLDAIKNDYNITWSEPYVDHGTGEFTITASKHVLDQRVIGVDILLSEISKKVSDSKIGENGNITILSGSGYVLASNNSNWLGQLWDDTVGAEISYKEMINRSYNKDHKAIYYSNHLERSGMTIIAVVDRSEIFQTLILVFFMIFFVAIMIIIIAERISIKYVDKIVKPISRLVSTMQRVEEGNYELKCAVEDDSLELVTLVTVFNHMIESINEKNLEMQALYEELYASEETLQEQYDVLYENKEFIKKSEERYALIFEASKEGLWDTDASLNINYLTPLWYQDFDLDLNNSNTSDWIDLIHPEEREQVRTLFFNHIQNEGETYRTEYRILNKNGDYIWVEAIGKAKFIDGKFISMSGSHQNITSRKQYELKIHDMAYKDALTKLYNRSYFDEVISQVLLNDEKGSLLFINIDNFKYINDIYGHSFGDEVLRQLAERLRKVACDTHKLLLARFSGNEFIVLLRNIVDPDAIIFIINTLNTQIEMPIQSDSKFIRVTASFGITIFPDDGRSGEQLLQNADIAMYHAKRVTKKLYHFYDYEIMMKAISEMEIENSLRAALEDDEFLIYYQPIMSMKDKEVKGFEALIRWESKHLGFVYPDVFIPIAERTGWINEIGFMVIDKACAFISGLNNRLGAAFSISINISVVQLMEDHFVNRVLALIEKNNLPKHLVILEITESLMLDSNENILAKLFYLRNQQVNISLDDFGTGYSSFNNLIRLPLSAIKMDKSIMKDSITNEHVLTLLESIVQFAHKINIEVVAEGIEDLRYLEKSQFLNVDYVQGYHFSRPVPEKQVEALVGHLNQLCLDKDVF